jgi:micrococcal nuclease
MVDGQSQSVRLLGIDTPETKDPRKPVQCFGEQASARTHDLLDGREVWLEFDPSQGRKDRYGRLLAYVWLDHSSMVNETLIREGFAHKYTYDDA